MDCIEIRMSVKIKDILIDFDIYDKWLEYTNEHFKYYKEFKQEELQVLKNKIQDSIDRSDIMGLLNCSVDQDLAGCDHYFIEMVKNLRKNIRYSFDESEKDSIIINPNPIKITI